MEILTRARCSECGGSGVVQHPAWVMFRAERKDAGALDVPTQEEASKWFRSWGWTRVPDEEVPCLACKGKGTVETWVRVEETNTGCLRRVQ